MGDGPRDEDRRATPWWIATVGGIAAVVVTILLVDPLIWPLIEPICETDAVDRIHNLLKHLGRAPLLVGVWIVCCIVAAIARSRHWWRASGLVALTLALGLGAAYALKAGIARPRPCFAARCVPWHEAVGRWEAAGEGEYHSLPSGDVTLAGGLAMLGFLFARRGWVRWGLFLMPLLSGLSRVLRGMHNPSDCLAGLLLGAGIAAVLWRLWPPIEDADAIKEPETCNT